MSNSRTKYVAAVTESRLTAQQKTVKLIFVLSHRQAAITYKSMPEPLISILITAFTFICTI